MNSEILAKNSEVLSWNSEPARPFPPVPCHAGESGRPEPPPQVGATEAPDLSGSRVRDGDK
jgi:hypothetical protein